MDNNKITGYNDQRLKDRAIDEMIGMCKVVLIDGSVSTDEAIFLLNWLNANPIVSTDWFGKDLYETLLHFLNDGVISSDEELKLLNILTDITGRSEVNTDGINAATTLPLCKNPPNNITLKNNNFILTGNFVRIKRKDLERYIKKLGGAIKKTPTGTTDYLIIGDEGSSAWMHSTFGRKIEVAVAVREKGHSIAIISEDHFFKCIDINRI